MTVGDLIKNKDYDYISYRLLIPDLGDVFIGSCASKNGELIFFGNDTDYSEDDVVVSYEEWTKPEKDIYSGLTVVVEGCDV